MHINDKTTLPAIYWKNNNCTVADPGEEFRSVSAKNEIHRNVKKKIYPAYSWYAYNSAGYFYRKWRAKCEIYMNEKILQF